MMKMLNTLLAPFHAIVLTRSTIFVPYPATAYRVADLGTENLNDTTSEGIASVISKRNCPTIRDIRHDKDVFSQGLNVSE